MAKKDNIKNSINNMPLLVTDETTDHAIHSRGMKVTKHLTDALKRAEVGSIGNSKISRIAGSLHPASSRAQETVGRRRAHKKALRSRGDKLSALADTITALEARIKSLEDMN
jgi:hypothetical protein